MTDTPEITAIRAAMRLFESATCTTEIEAALDAFELASGPEEMARLINYIDAQQAEIARLRETITDTDVYISEILTREKNNGLVDQQNYARLVNAEAEIERLRADADNAADTAVIALRKAWQLGQTYWQQADSEYTSHHAKADVTQQNKADVTQQKFKTLCDETSAAMKGATP